MIHPIGPVERVLTLVDLLTPWTYDRFCQFEDTGQRELVQTSKDEVQPCVVLACRRCRTRAVVNPDHVEDFISETP